MSEITNTCLIYSVKEASNLLGVSTAKMYDLIRNDKVPNIKFGKRYVIPIKAFNQWLENSCKVGDFI